MPLPGAVPGYAPAPYTGNPWDPYTGAGGGTNVANPKKAAKNAAMQAIFDIIKSGGATDPRLLNQQITGIQRSGESDVQGLEESAAAGGIDNAGLVAALGLARKQGTAGQISQARADEAARIEARKRQDIIDLIFPLLGFSAQRRGQSLGAQGPPGANAGQSQAQYGAYAAAIASIIASLGGGGGGNPGDGGGTPVGGSGGDMSYHDPKF